MGIELTPERQAFLREEAARIGVPEDEIAERAVLFYEQQLDRLREELDNAEAQIARGDVSEWDPQAFKVEMKKKYAHLINAADLTRSGRKERSRRHLS